MREREREGLKSKQLISSKDITRIVIHELKFVKIQNENQRVKKMDILAITKDAYIHKFIFHIV